MADGWRLSLRFNDRPGAGKKSDCPTAVRDLLRSRFSDDISVSAGKMHVFLYAGTVDAAEEAEQVAREVIAQQSLSADVRLERWDPSSQAWQDVQAGAPDGVVAGLSAAQEDNPRRGRLRSAFGAVLGVLEHIDPLPESGIRNQVAAGSRVPAKSFSPSKTE